MSDMRSEPVRGGADPAPRDLPAAALAAVATVLDPILRMVR